MWQTDAFSSDSMSLYLIQFKWNIISDMLSSYSIICHMIWDSYSPFVAHQYFSFFGAHDFTFVLIVFYLQKQESSHLLAERISNDAKEKADTFFWTKRGR